jgi:hypothetical protein
MTDILKEVKRISDPITVSLYVKDGKRILLLGDRHLLNKDCKSCEPPKCLDYLSLVKGLDKYHKETNTDLDVFFEGFAPNNGRNSLEKTKRYLAELADRYFLMYKGTPLHLYNVRKALLPKAYFHNTGLNQRYHYIDHRLTSLFVMYGFNLLTIIMGTLEEKILYRTSFMSMYPNKTSYINIIKEFCFAKPFDPSLKPRSLLSKGMTKIGKQFHKLEAADQRLVKAFVIKRVHTLMDKYNYKGDLDEFLTNVFYMSALFMDVYAICRFLYYYHRQSEGSTSVFIAGAAHTFNYNLFMKEWGAKEIDEHTYKLEDLTKQSKACTKVDFHKLPEIS